MLQRHRRLGTSVGARAYISLGREELQTRLRLSSQFGGFAGVFGTSAGLGKIGVRGFQHWILVAMSKLALHGGIAGRLLRFVLLNCAFTAVLIIGESRIQILHGVGCFWSQSCSVLVPGQEMHQPSTVAYRETSAGGKG